MANSCPWGVGSKTKTFIAFESNYGEKPADAASKSVDIYFNTNGVQASQNTTNPSTIRGNRNPVEPIMGNIDVTGDIVSGFVYATNGNTGTGGSYQRTGFIPVNPYKIYRYSGRIYNWAGVAGYGEDKTFKQNILMNADTEVTYEKEVLNINPDVRYIIATTKSENFPLNITEEKEIPDLSQRDKNFNDLSEKVNGMSLDLMPIYEHFSSFLNFTAIGDSLTFGLSPKTYDTSGYPASWGGNNNCSWVRRLATLTGADAINLGYSGATAKTWYLSTSQGGTGGYNAMINGKRTQAYLIGLGINDVISETYPIGSLSDVDFDNRENNADSFIGWYAKIIQSIMEFNPKAKIFVFNNPKATDATAQKYIMLNTLCEDPHFKGTVYFVSFEEWKKYFEADCVQKWREGVHYSPPAYHQIARIMLSALSKRMCDSFKEFETIYNIPYDV